MDEFQSDCTRRPNSGFDRSFKLSHNLTAIIIRHFYCNFGMVVDKGGLCNISINSTSHTLLILLQHDVQNVLEFHENKHLGCLLLFAHSRKLKFSFELRSINTKGVYSHELISALGTCHSNLVQKRAEK